MAAQRAALGTTYGKGFSTCSDFTVAEGERVAFVLTWHPSHEPRPNLIEPFEALDATLEDWQEWAARCRYQGPTAPR